MSLTIVMKLTPILYKVTYYKETYLDDKQSYLTKLNLIQYYILSLITKKLTQMSDKISYLLQKNLLQCFIKLHIKIKLTTMIDKVTDYKKTYTKDK